MTDIAQALRNVANSLTKVSLSMGGQHAPDISDAALEIGSLATRVESTIARLTAEAAATTENRIAAAQQRAADGAPAGHATAGRIRQPVPGTDAFGEQVLALLEAQDGGGVFGESSPPSSVASSPNSHEAPDFGDQVLAILERDGFGAGATPSPSYDGSRAASALADRGGRPVAAGRKVTLLDTMNGIVDGYNARRAAREAARG